MIRHILKIKNYILFFKFHVIILFKKAYYYFPTFNNDSIGDSVKCVENVATLC